MVRAGNGCSRRAAHSVEQIPTMEPRTVRVYCWPMRDAMLVVVLRDATAFEAASLTISSAQRITTVTVKYRYARM
jgi:hypothetical protein